MRTLRPVFLFIATLFCIGSAEAQAVRYDYFASTTSAQCAPGKQCPLNVLPGTQVNICGGAIATFAACLASPSTTYTNSGAGTPCATTSQLTPATGGACRATADNQGGYGWWILPGSYNYFLRVPATAGGGTYGPFPLFIGASAGCPLGAACDTNFSTIAAACSAAGAETLYVTRNWTATPSQTLSCGLQFLGNGKLTLAAGATVVIAGSLSAPVRQRLFDVSASGSAVSIAQPIDIYPEWWGAVAGQDSTAAFQAILNTVSGTSNAIHIQIPNNTGVCYWISSALTHDGTNGSVLDVEGEVNTFGARLGSCLEWHGSLGGALTHFSNEFNPTFRHFGVRGNALAKQLLWLDTSNNSFNTQSVQVEDMSFAGMAGVDSAGLQLSNPACTNNNVSGIDVLNSQFIGTGVTGLDTGIRYYCGGNSKNLTVHGAASRMTNLGWGMQAVNGGWIEFDSVYFGANLVEDLQMDVGHLILRACDSEGSAKLVTMGSGPVRSTLTITDGYVFASGIVASDDIIATLNGVALTINGSDFYNNRTGSSVAKIVLSSGFDPFGCTGTVCGSDAIVSTNNFYQNATDASGVFFDAASSPLCVNRGTYYAANANQVPCLSLGDHGGLVGVQPLLAPYSPFNPRVYVPFNGPSTICLPPEITYDTLGNEYRCVAANTWVAAGAVASYIATETGASNAIAGAPTFPPTLAAGLQLRVKLAHSLQAGANTFAYNGGSAVAVKSSRNPANDIGTAYVSGGFINLLYTGSVWVDISQ